MVEYQKLYKKYINQQEHLSFTKEEVVERIIRKFKAEEFSKSEVLDLVNDDQLEYSKIFKCFAIRDSKILNKFFSSEEVKYYNEQKLDNKENPLDFNKVKKKEHDYNYLLIDEQEGRRVDVFLESKNNKDITNFIVRDRCEGISRYINALVLGALIQKGNEDIKADLEDDEFKYYLENLDRFGFLN